MSRIVAGLARSRLVEITKDRQDARRMHIRATVKGTKLLQKGRQLRIADLARQLEQLGPQELSRLNETVEILGQLLQKWR